MRRRSALKTPSCMKSLRIPRAALSWPRISRSGLKSAGASVVSYIPNNAYLVRASGAVARQLQADSRTQSVLPYEPYYKLKPSLLKLAVANDSRLRAAL